MRLLCLAVVASLAAPALAEEPKKEKLVCKRNPDASTGSNIRRSTKTCLTAAEWAALDKQRETAMRTLQERSGLRKQPEQSR